MKIKKDHRAYKFSHRMPRVEGSKTKAFALNDISKECGEGKFFIRNYLLVEHLVMGVNKYGFLIISI